MPDKKTKSTKTRGRPIGDSQVCNIVGLMRYMMAGKTGLNLLLSGEIERMTGKQIISPANDSEDAIQHALKLSGQKVSDFVACRKPAPDWIKSAAHDWVVSRIHDLLKSKHDGYTGANLALNMPAGSSRYLIAEGIVGYILTAIRHEDEEKAKEGMDLIDTLIRQNISE